MLVAVMQTRLNMMRSQIWFASWVC